MSRRLTGAEDYAHIFLRIVVFTSSDGTGMKIDWQSGIVVFQELHHLSPRRFRGFAWEVHQKCQAFLPPAPIQRVSLTVPTQTTLHSTLRILKQSSDVRSGFQPGCLHEYPRLESRQLLLVKQHVERQRHSTSVVCLVQPSRLQRTGGARCSRRKGT